MGRFADAWRTLLRPGWDQKLAEHEARFRQLGLEVNAALDMLQHRIWRDTKRQQRAIEKQLTGDEQPTAPAPTSKTNHRGAIAARVRASLSQPTRVSDESSDADRKVSG